MPWKMVFVSESNWSLPDWETGWGSERQTCLQCANLKVAHSRARDYPADIMVCRRGTGRDNTCIATRYEGQCGREAKLFVPATAPTERIKFRKGGSSNGEPEFSAHPHPAHFFRTEPNETQGNKVRRRKLSPTATQPSQEHSWKTEDVSVSGYEVPVFLQQKARPPQR